VAHFRIYPRISVSFFAIFFILGCEGEESDQKEAKYVVHVGNQVEYVEVKENNVRTVQVKVLAFDSTAKPGVNVFFSVDDGTASIAESSVMTDVNGIAATTVTLSTASETVIIGAHVPGLQDSPLRFYFYMTETVPASIEIISGNFQEAPAHTTLDEELWIKVSDKFGNPVQHSQVVFTVESGGGDVLWNTSTTDQNGKAYNEFTVGGNDPVNVIAAKIGDVQTTFTQYTLVPVTLNEATSESGHVFLSWTKNTNPTFSDYTIYRSPDRVYNYQPIGQISDQEVTTFNDVTANIGEDYSYYVQVNTARDKNVKSNFKTGQRGEYIDLKSEYNARDIEISNDKATIYVADWMNKRILLIDTETFSRTDSISLSVAPNNISLSVDQTKLYVAVSGTSRFLVVDLATKSVLHDIDIGTELSSTSIAHVYQTADGILFASGYGGYIVRIDEDDNFTASRVASGLAFFSGVPHFIGDHGSFLYVGESHLSPNSLFKLDLSVADAPLILEDEHGTVGNIEYAVLSPDGQYIHCLSQILNTNDFNSEGELAGSVYGLQVSQLTDNLFACMYGGSFANPSKLSVINRTMLTIEKEIPIGFQSRQIFLSQDETFAFMISTPDSPLYRTRIYKINLTL